MSASLWKGSALTSTSVRQKAIKSCFLLLLGVHYFSQLRILTSQTQNLAVTSLRPFRAGPGEPRMCSLFVATVNFMFTGPRITRYTHVVWDVFPHQQRGGNKDPHTAASDILGTEWANVRQRHILLLKRWYESRLDGGCIGDGLMRSLWQARPISQQRFQMSPIKPVISHVA